MERSLKRRNRPVPVRENAGPFQAIAFISVAASYLLFQRHRRQLAAIQWRQLPVLKQFNILLFGSGGTKLQASKGQPQSTKQRKAKAAKPLSAGPTPAQAAGAAAAARSEAAAAPQPGPPPKKPAAKVSAVMGTAVMLCMDVSLHGRHKHGTTSCAMRYSIADQSVSSPSSCL